MKLKDVIIEDKDNKKHNNIMENSELQKIWKSVDSEINMKSKEELGLLLTSKAKQTINKFRMITGISAIICLGLLVWLIVTALNRSDDKIYMINNITLGLITLISFVSALWSIYKLQDNKLNKPLKEWLEERIKILSKWLTGAYNKLYVILIPIIYVLMVLSIHVYYENEPYMDVLKNGESLTGLMVGTPIGLFVAFFAISKIRKYELKTLEFLKDLYGRL